MLVNQLQDSLQYVYEIKTDHSISDFLTTSTALKKTLLRKSRSSRETVFFRFENNEMEIAVYYDDEIYNHPEIETGNHKDAYCCLLEGVSHFLYLVHRGNHDQEIVLLEMELQAEIDKFIMLSCQAESQQATSSAIHDHVFSDCAFLEELDPEQAYRYREANYLAGKYCSYLLNHYIRSSSPQKLLQELRRFYRLSMHGKIRRIQQLH